MLSAPTDAVVADYGARRAAYKAQGDDAARVDRRVAIVRLALFAAATLLIIALAESALDAYLGLTLLLVVAVAFVALVAWHSTVRDHVRSLRALERACDAGVARVMRRWDAMPPAADIGFSPDHAFAGDLHVAGAHSLVRLLPSLSRVAGQGVVAEWLLSETPAETETARPRQEAVRELVPHPEWRERLSVLASRLAGSRESIESFLAWAESRPVSHPSRGRRWLAIILGVATVSSLFAAIVGEVPAVLPLLFAAVNVVVTVATRRSTDRGLEAVAGHETRLRGVGDAIRHALSEQHTAPDLVALRERLGGNEAVRAFAWFDQIAKFAEVRLSPMGHYALQVLVLWDLHVVDALERWRLRHGDRARIWLRALGEIEALAAFATLAYDNPEWCFPTLEARAEGTLDATNLGHPLLSPTERVGNDVSLGGPGDVLFITGSNMSGKSTLLRAIGLNVVLAQAGGPVCASAMQLARVRLRTSVDATDALERGLSLFMAELLRIKAIVDAARDTADCPLLYIADETLRGTNARDRHAAVISILRQLVRAGAIGVVATHDPDLAADERLRPHIRPYHLLEQFRVEGRATSMWFDYRLRPGLATTRNAIQLLEMVGLGDAKDA